MNEIISINYCFPIHNIVLMGVGENDLSTLALCGVFPRKELLRTVRAQPLYQIT